jgi:hypothetical protein
MLNTLLSLFFLLLSSCGKVNQIQDAFLNLGASNDLKIQQTQSGKYYRHTEDHSQYPTLNDHLTFESKQFVVGAVGPEVMTFIQTLPRGRSTEVYFMGTFAKRSAISSEKPDEIFDVVDLTGLSKK